jgi:uncharacterized protein YegL
MPDPNKTEIIVVLDRSGSMQTIREDMTGGFATFIAEQNVVDGRCDVSLYTFDTVHEVEYEALPIVAVPPLRLFPRGGTALYDAVCMTIDKVGSRFRQLEDKTRPGKVVFVIITDGQENSSRRFGALHVKQKIEQQTKEYDWQFVFLGANIDVNHYSEVMGIRGQSTRGYEANARGVGDMYRATSTAVGAYRRGLRKSVSFEPSHDYSEEPKPEQEP